MMVDISPLYSHDIPVFDSEIPSRFPYFYIFLIHTVEKILYLGFLGFLDG
jgi:hypothetical protein